MKDWTCTPAHRWSRWPQALAISAVLGSVIPAAAGESELIDFEIKDQFDVVHRDEDLRGEVVVLIGSGKEGAEFNRVWGEAIRDTLAVDGLEQAYTKVAVADVRGVPFFLKGMVKGKFPEEPERWVLADWKGRFAQAYEFDEQSSNILIFDRKGSLVHQTAGRELETDTLAVIVTHLHALLRSEDEGGSE